MSAIQPFHATPDDLDGLDKKTAQGLEPLLDQLNTVMRQLTQAINSQPDSKTYTTTFSSEATGSAYVDFKPPNSKPTSVSLDWFQLADGSDVTSVYSYSTTLLDSGLVRLYFVGLDMSVKYQITVTIK